MFDECSVFLQLGMAIYNQMLTIDLMRNLKTRITRRNGDQEKLVQAEATR